MYKHKTSKTIWNKINEADGLITFEKCNRPNITLVISTSQLNLFRAL